MDYWATEYIKTADVTIGRPMFNPLADTVGRLFGVHRVLGSDPGRLSDQQVNDIAAKMGVDDVHVSLGGAEPFTRLMRMYKNKQVPLMEKVTGTVKLPIHAYRTSIVRMDHYDPASRTVTSFSKNPEILAHEFGHAVDPDIANYRKNILEREQFATDRANEAGYTSPILNKAIDIYKAKYKPQ